MRRSLMLAAVALSLPAVIWKPRPLRAATPVVAAAPAVILAPLLR